MPFTDAEIRLLIESFDEYPYKWGPILIKFKSQMRFLPIRAQAIYRNSDHMGLKRLRDKFRALRQTYQRLPDDLR